MSKRPIAMRCTEKQFKVIEPKLKDFKIIRLDDFKFFYYLANNFAGNKDQISNLHSSNIGLHKDYNVIEEWNEQIFLEACGIETEKTFSLTADQLRSITDPQVKQWFPEVFETVLEVGKWYVMPGHEKFIGCITEVKKDRFLYFGFNTGGRWAYKDYYEIKETLTEATEAEVFEALKNEAIKRGYKAEDYVLGLDAGGKVEKVSKCGFYFDLKIGLNLGNVKIFNNGIWAEIIPTKTKAEAEKELNCKIVD